MPRQPRYFIPGVPQHVICRGVDRQAVFFQTSDYELYLKALASGAANCACDIHAYVLMTNHVHLLLSPRTERSLPLLMQSLGRNYVQRLNEKHDRTGTLWQGRYKASLVQSERYLLSCYCYIEMNPVRAGIVAGPGDYRFSSYRSNALGRRNALITPHQTYRALGKTVCARQAAYRQLFATPVQERLLTQIRTTTNACLVLGDDRYQDHIEQMLGRPVRHRQGGRPRKRVVGKNRGSTPI